MTREALLTPELCGLAGPPPWWLLPNAVSEPFCTYLPADLNRSLFQKVPFVGSQTPLVATHDPGVRVCPEHWESGHKVLGSGSSPSF